MNIREIFNYGAHDRAIESINGSRYYPIITTDGRLNPIGRALLHPENFTGQLIIFPIDGIDSAV